MSLRGLRRMTMVNIFHNYINAIPNKPWSLRFCSTSLLKTLLEKGKFLVTSNSFFPTVFSSHKENSLPFSWNSKSSSANSFSLEEFKTLSYGNGLSPISHIYIYIYLSDSRNASILRSLQIQKHHCNRSLPPSFGHCVEWDRVVL